MKPLSNNKTPGAMMRMARAKRGVSQAALAVAIKVSPGYLCMIETGNRHPTLEKQKLISKYLRIEGAAFARACVRFSNLKKDKFMKKILPLLVVFLLAGCGVRTTKGQTIAEFEASNPGYHYTTSVFSGTTETRTYRNWKWSSFGSYFKPNRTNHVVFESGVLVSKVDP